MNSPNNTHNIQHTEYAPIMENKPVDAMDIIDLTNDPQYTQEPDTNASPGPGFTNILSRPIPGNIKYSFIHGIHDRNTEHCYILKQNKDTHEFKIRDPRGVISLGSVNIGAPEVLVAAGYSIYHIGLHKYTDFIIFVYYKADKLCIDIAQVVDKSLKFIKHVNSNIKDLKTTDILRAGTFTMNSTNYLYIYETRAAPCLHFIDLSTFKVRTYVLDAKTAYNIASDGAPLFCCHEQAYYGLRPMRKMDIGRAVPRNFTMCAPFIIGCSMFLYSRDELSREYINGIPAPNGISINETIYEFGGDLCIITRAGPKLLIAYNNKLNKAGMKKLEYDSDIADMTCMPSCKMIVLVSGVVYKL